jgi:hypothetical protein
MAGVHFVPPTHLTYQEPCGNMGQEDLYELYLSSPLELLR